MIKNANISDVISVVCPNEPDIIDCNILSDTLGMVNAPNAPMSIYNPQESTVE